MLQPLINISFSLNNKRTAPIYLLLFHITRPLKATFLVCNHNAIASLSHPLCAPIAATLRTASIQRDFKRF